MTTHSLAAFLDPLLIWAYRLGAEITGSSLAGFYIGTFWVCLLATILGELTYGGIYYLNRRHFARIRREMVMHNNLSIKAIAVRDKTSYKACNSIANEAFGLNMFSGIALFASSVWPAFFALAWLDVRFSEVLFTIPVSLPAMGDTVGYTFIFIPMYIVMRILFARIKGRLPVFSAIKEMMRKNEEGEQMLGWDHLVSGSGKERKAESSS